MNTPVKLSVGVLFGLMCGAMIGTIIGSAYLTLALRRGVAGFDMFSVWTASEGLRAMHPEAFKVVPLERCGTVSYTHLTLPTKRIV